jgi:hypothetical protein
MVRINVHVAPGSFGLLPASPEFFSLFSPSKYGASGKSTLGNNGVVLLRNLGTRHVRRCEQTVILLDFPIPTWGDQYIGEKPG